MHLKHRALYLALVFLTIALGLLSRSDVVSLPNFVALYAGDTLWALMVYWGFRMLLPTRAIVIAAGFALLFAFSIEFLQLFDIATLDSIRNTTIGGLVLGFGFKASDLVCYTVGVAIGTCIDFVLQRKPRIG